MLLVLGRAVSGIGPGAARGLGRVTAQAFAEEGARVVVTDIDEPGGQETLRLVRAVGGEGLFFRSDVGVESDVEAMLKNTVDVWIVRSTTPALSVSHRCR